VVLRLVLKPHWLKGFFFEQKLMSENFDPAAGSGFAVSLTYEG
jgi:hypothetical protein